LSISSLTEMAKRMRLLALRIGRVVYPQGIHLGGSFSAAEVYAVLYGSVLKYDVSNPLWEERDRFFAGKEHARPIEYAALCEVGFLKEEEVLHYEDDGAKLAGHPYLPECGLEFSSCSLGTAFPFAVGTAIAAKGGGRVFGIYTLLGDGECYEGTIWESAMVAAHYKLDNLTAILDNNGLSADDKTDSVVSFGSFAKKWEAFGWHVSECDGHSVASLLSAFEDRQPLKPHIVIAHTVKGKGVSFMEHVPQWHRSVLTDELYETAKAEIEGRAMYES